MNDQQNLGLSAKVSDLWQRNKDLLRNAGSLAATTGLTSLFGFVFWIVADHKFSKSEAGYAIAATNAMQLFGTIGMFGLGTMLIGELPKRQRERGGLFAASVATAGIGSSILGLIFAVVVGLYFSDEKHLPGIGGTPGQMLIFVVGVTLTGATLVFDEGTIGLLRGGVQLWRNMALSAIKLAVLPVLALFLHDAYGVGISLSFVIATAGSVIPAAIMLTRGGSSIFYRPDWAGLRRLLPVAISHNWLNLAMATPSRIIPIVVPLAVGAAENSAFYDAWMISSLLFMVPVHLGTVLFALGSVPLWLLIIGYIPQMPRAQFIAVSRATNRVGQAAGLICFFALGEIASIYFGGKLGSHYIGGKLGGLYGLSFAYLGVLVIEGLITAPTVLRAAYAHTAAATGAFPAVTTATPAVAASGPLRRITGELARLTGALPQLTGVPDRQESGLAALFAIASAAVASDGNTLNVATQIWRTGSFPQVPSEATGPRKVVPPAPTLHDMYAGQAAPTGQTPVQQANYRRRQQAGIDALLSIATPVFPAEDPQEEARR